MAKSGDHSISPGVGLAGAFLIAVFGVALCTGQKGKDTPAPTPSPSMSVSEKPALIEGQP